MAKQEDVTGAPETQAAAHEDYADVGVRVAGVLNAAEEAAEQIRTDARRSAEDIRRQAEADARKLTSHRRREADEEARRVIAEAQAEAQAIKEAAQAGARQIEEAGLERQEQFRRYARTLEQRVERALDGLRDVTSQLQDVVLDAAPDAAPATVAESPAAASRNERRRGRFGLGGLLAKDEETADPEAGGADADVYDSLRGAVEKVGERWVPAVDDDAANGHEAAAAPDEAAPASSRKKP